MCVWGERAPRYVVIYDSSGVARLAGWLANSSMAGSQGKAIQSWDISYRLIGTSAGAVGMSECETVCLCCALIYQLWDAVRAAASLEPRQPLSRTNIYRTELCVWLRRVSDPLLYLFCHIEGLGDFPILSILIISAFCSLATLAVLNRETSRCCLPWGISYHKSSLDKWWLKRVVCN